MAKNGEMSKNVQFIKMETELKIAQNGPKWLKKFKHQKVSLCSSLRWKLINYKNC